MDQYPDEQNSMQSSGAAANGTSFDEDAETAIEEYFKSFPCGYRFAPSDYELVENYLMKKINNQPLPPNLIVEVNLYSKDPTQLIVEYKPITETEWYFFTPRNKKYPKGSRPNRGTPNGYWKPTGTDKAIPRDSQHPVGYKVTLDFYRGSFANSKKTDWKMHEYKVNNNNSQHNGRAKDDKTLDDWVLCKIYKKKEKNGGDGTGTNGTQPPTGNNNIGFYDQNRNASQPTVNVSQNNEASLMAENNNIEFEGQNWNASQPTVNVLQNNEASLMTGNNNIGFEDQNWNASQPTVNVLQNNEDSVMEGNNNIWFEDQNWNASQPTVNVPQNNEASLMVGNNNIGFEDQNWNASQPTVNVLQNNEASLMAGNNNIGFEDQHCSASQPTVNVLQNNEASLMAGNNKIEFEYQNWNACQPTPNQGPMHGEPRTFQSSFMDSRIDDLIEEAYYIWNNIDRGAFDG
ncbi:hypothetical protein CRYUN_Cryun08bG0095200 [Craigia yunnanensis]